MLKNSEFREKRKISESLVTVTEVAVIVGIVRVTVDTVIEVTLIVWSSAVNTYNFPTKKSYLS